MLVFTMEDREAVDCLEPLPMEIALLHVILVNIAVFYFTSELTRNHEK